MPIVPLPEDIERFRGLPTVLLGRVSSKVQESDGYSLTAQENDGRQAAAMLQVNLVGTDFEQGSGTDWDLEGLTEQLRRIERGEVKALIIKNVSRLSRDPAKQAYIENKLEKAGALLWYYDEKYADSAAGRLQRRMMVSVAAFMLEQAREDSMRARREKVVGLGRPVGNGPLPYGWKRQIDRSGARPRTVGYEHDTAQAGVIKRFRSLRTMTTRALSDQLQAEGVPVPASFRPSKKRPCAGRWEPYVIRHILANRMVWGEYRYGERERYKVNGRWRQRPKPNADVVTLQLEPILERWEVEELREIISKRTPHNTAARVTPRRAYDPFTLRGMLACGLCGSTLRTLTAGGKGRSGGEDRYYRCPLTNRRIAERQGRDVCTLPPVAADRVRRGAAGGGVEDIIWDEVEAFWRDEEALRAVIRQARMADPSAAEHAEKLADARAELAETRDAHQRAADRWATAADELDRQTFESTRQRLKRDITLIESSLRRLEQTVPRGISDDDEAAVLALGRELRGLLVEMTRETHHGFYQQIRFRATVTPAVAQPSDGTYQLGRHRYALDGRALGQPMRRSTGDNFTWLSLELLRLDRRPVLNLCGFAPLALPLALTGTDG